MSSSVSFVDRSDGDRPNLPTRSEHGFPEDQDPIRHRVVQLLHPGTKDSLEELGLLARKLKSVESLKKVVVSTLIEHFAYARSNEAADALRPLLVFTVNENLGNDDSTIFVSSVVEAIREADYIDPRRREFALKFTALLLDMFDCKRSEGIELVARLSDESVFDIVTLHTLEEIAKEELDSCEGPTYTDDTSDLHRAHFDCANDADFTRFMKVFLIQDTDLLHIPLNHYLNHIGCNPDDQARWKLSAPLPCIAAQSVEALNITWHSIHSRLKESNLEQCSAFGMLIDRSLFLNLINWPKRSQEWPQYSNNTEKAEFQLGYNSTIDEMVGTLCRMLEDGSPEIRAKVACFFYEAPIVSDLCFVHLKALSSTKKEDEKISLAYNIAQVSPNFALSFLNSEVFEGITWRIGLPFEGDDLPFQGSGKLSKQIAEVIGEIFQNLSDVPEPGEIGKLLLMVGRLPPQDRSVIYQRLEKHLRELEQTSPSVGKELEHALAQAVFNIRDLSKVFPESIPPLVAEQLESLIGVLDRDRPPSFDPPLHVITHEHSPNIEAISAVSTPQEHASLEPKNRSDGTFSR